jgi:sulfotransferase
MQCHLEQPSKSESMLNKKIIYVAGLPHSGANFLNQLFSQHPDIYSTGQTSPLCALLIGLRRQFSDDKFLLSQLDRSINAFLTHKEV